MQFLALTALALTLIGRCLAEPIPLDAIRRDDLEARAPPPPHPINGFWDCLRCSTECSAVVIGCSLVCGAAEVDAPLCGLCIAGAGGSKACVECFPRCRGKEFKHKYIPGKASCLERVNGIWTSKPGC